VLEGGAERERRNDAEYQQKRETVEFHSETKQRQRRKQTPCVIKLSGKKDSKEDEGMWNRTQLTGETQQLPAVPLLH
jgi:hypothetical protein